MARRVSVDDIRLINDVYYVCKSYAETARRTGWSAATVRTYVDKNYSPLLEDSIHRFDPNTELPDFSTEIFRGIENYGELCALSEEELAEIKQLWEEIPI